MRTFDEIFNALLALQIRRQSLFKDGFRESFSAMAGESILCKLWHPNGTRLTLLMNIKSGVIKQLSNK